MINKTVSLIFLQSVFFILIMAFFSPVMASNCSCSSGTCSGGSSCSASGGTACACGCSGGVAFCTADGLANAIDTEPFYLLVEQLNSVTSHIDRIITNNEQKAKLLKLINNASAALIANDRFSYQVTLESIEALSRELNETENAKLTYALKSLIPR